MSQPETDPNEQANISGADLAILVDELKLANARLAMLDELNPALISILGRPNFTCIQLAKLMRLAGHKINTRSEDEQAAGIFFLLKLYIQHGDAWSDIAQIEIQVMINKAKER